MRTECINCQLGKHLGCSGECNCECLTSAEEPSGNPVVLEEEVPKIKNIENGMVYALVAPLIQARISGAYKAGFDNTGKITLIYEDLTHESAQFELEEAQGIAEVGIKNWFHIVGAVQEKRLKNDL